MSVRWTAAFLVTWAACGVAQAQTSGDPLALLAEAEAACAEPADAGACDLAKARLGAALPAVIAEAGNSRDRAAYIDLIRPFLGNETPEIRTSAFFALAKLQPDATDTPAIMAALFDPVSNVRGGAWAAAKASSDPAARAVGDRVPIRPAGRGYGPDPLAYDAAALGVPIPQGADYIWLTARLRDVGQLHFLTNAPVADVLAHFAPLAAGPALSPDAATRTYPDAAFLFGDFAIPSLFGDPQILLLPATEGRTARMVAVYRDIVFGRTGFAVVQESQRAVEAPPAAAAPEPPPGAETDAFAATPAQLSGVDPAASEEETELYMAIRSAHGLGAEGYLELFPNGAYAEEMRAIVAGPRMVLDAPTYADTAQVTVSLRNLPPGSAATVTLHAMTDDYPLVDTLYLPDATAGPGTFVLAGKHPPGIYLVQARVTRDGGEAPIFLVQDLSITAAAVDLHLDKTDFAQGEPMTVQFAGMSGDARDYLATAPAGSPGSTYLQYLYLDGQAKGTARLTAPTAPGTYELRAFFRDDDSQIRASLPFTVTGAPVADPDPPPTSTTVAPAPPVSTPPTGGATLTMEKSVLSPGEPIRLTFSGMSGDRADFIATAPAGSGPESYLSFVYTNGARDGTASLTAPEKEGAYELRALFAADAGAVQAMLPFTVQANVQLTLDKTSFRPGEAMRVTFAGFTGATQDYVATAPAGSPVSTYIAYSYVNGAREGSLSLNAPDAPGAYELRAILQHDPNVVKVSLPFAVE